MFGWLAPVVCAAWLTRLAVQWHSMCVVDPFELSHNTTSAVSGKVLDHLVSAMRLAADLLRRALADTVRARISVSCAF